MVGLIFQKFREKLSHGRNVGRDGVRRKLPEADRVNGIKSSLGVVA